MIPNKIMLKILKKISDEENIRDYLFVMYGKLNQDLIISAVELIGTKLKLENFDRTTITKTKIISTEIMQNIIKHQENHSEIFPYFIIGSKDRSLNIFSGNIVTLNDKILISDKLNTFISIDKDKMREYYRKALEESVITAEGNAGIGLMDIAFRSNQKLSYQMENVTDNLFSFNLNVLIN